jgi:hypothetical protein
MAYYISLRTTIFRVCDFETVLEYFVSAMSLPWLFVEDVIETPGSQSRGRVACEGFHLSLIDQQRPSSIPSHS